MVRADLMRVLADLARGHRSFLTWNECPAIKSFVPLRHQQHEVFRILVVWLHAVLHRRFRVAYWEGGEGENSR